MKHSLADVTLCCEIFNWQNWKGAEISDNAKRNTENLSKPPHGSMCTYFCRLRKNLIFFCTLPLLLYPVSGNSKESTRLDASLPEDGSRVGFHNIVFFLKDIEYWINKEIVSVSNTASSKPYIFEYSCRFIYLFFPLLFFPHFILSCYNFILL